MSRYKNIAMAFLVTLPLAACAISDGPIEGRVLEAETRKPVAGAIVVVRWEGSFSAIVDTRNVCYHVETATTDADGRYKIPAWSLGTKGPLFSEGSWYMDIYKRGYEEYRPQSFIATDEYQKYNIRYLRPFTGTREERFTYFRRMGAAVSCHQAEESEKNLLPFVRALYEEVADQAKDQAKTEWENKIANMLLFRLEAIERGYDAAERRESERMRKRP